MSDEWRMDAYYYGFEATGVEAIDRILSAVASAGKSYHHTESWCDDTDPPEYLRGANPVEWIQNAANDAAVAFQAAAPVPAGQGGET
jgi:hypothetical protein